MRPVFCPPRHPIELVVLHPSLYPRILHIASSSPPPLPPPCRHQLVSLPAAEEGEKRRETFKIQLPARLPAESAVGGRNATPRCIPPSDTHVRKNQPLSHIPKSNVVENSHAGWPSYVHACQPGPSLETGSFGDH